MTRTKQTAVQQKRTRSVSPAPASKKAISKATSKNASNKRSQRSVSPSPAPRTPVKGKQQKGRSVTPVKRSTTPIKGKAPEAQKKRKGNDKQKEIILVSDSEDEPTVTPQKKKLAKNAEKTKEKETKAGKVTPKPVKSVTPIKSAAIPKKKRKTEEEKQVLPSDATLAVREIILQNKNHKLTAEKIVDLVSEEYRSVSEIAVFTAIAELFRLGHISEHKSQYTIEEYTQVQLLPPVVAVIDIEEEAPVALAEEEVQMTIEPEVAEEVAATQSTKKSVAKEESIASVKKSVAKEDATGSVKKSVSKEESIALEKKSAAKENVSANKSVTKATTSVSKSSVSKVAAINEEGENFADNVINTEENQA